MRSATRRALLALMSILVTLSPSVPPMAAAARDGIPLVSGTIDGVPSADLSRVRLEVLTWDAVVVPVGAPIPQTTLATGVPEADGSYSLRTFDIARLLQAAEENGEFANLELRARLGGRVVTSFFSFGVRVDGRLPAHGRWVSGMSGAPPSVSLSFRPGSPGLGRFHPPTSGAPGPRPPCLTWVRSRSLASRWGTIGEVHRWGPAIPSNHFIYGRTADSDFEVGFRAGLGAWGIQGVSHVGNSNSTFGEAGVSGDDPATGYKVEALFTRAEFAQVCTNNLKRQVTGWDGVNVRRGPAIPGLDGECSMYPAAYRNVFPASQEAWSRLGNESVTWSLAIDLGPVTAGGHSGFSSSARSVWTFDDGRKKTLCGNDADITRSHRVLAGA